jgi:hypothetical protein
MGSGLLESAPKLYQCLSYLFFNPQTTTMIFIS